MSNLRLRPGVNFTPSGMPYTDPRTGAKFDGYERHIDDVVQRIIQHRQRNDKIYPAAEPQWFDAALVKQEFLRHVQNKAPHLIHSSVSLGAMQTAQATPAACPKCGGTQFEETVCPTCSGRKITGRTCKSCGYKMSL